MDPNEKVNFEKLTTQYIEDQKIPDLMESYTKQLLLHQPEDPIQFLIELINNKRSRRLIFITGGIQQQRQEIADAISRSFNYQIVSLGQDEAIKAKKSEIVNQQAKKAITSVEKHFRGIIVVGYPFNFETSIFAQQNGFIPERTFILENSVEESKKHYVQQFNGDNETAERAVKRDELNIKEVKQMYSGLFDTFDITTTPKESVIDNIKSILKVKDKIVLPLRSPRVMIVRPPHLRLRAQQIQSLLCSKYGFNQIQTYEMLDWHIKQKTAIGKFVYQAFSNLQRVPDDIIIGLLRSKMLCTSSKERGFVTEGFPRSKAQLQSITSYNMKPDLVVILDLEEDALIQAYQELLTDSGAKRYYETTQAASQEGVTNLNSLVKNSLDLQIWQKQVNEYKELAKDTQTLFGNHAQTFKLNRETNADILSQIDLLLGNQQVYS